MKKWFGVVALAALFGCQPQQAATPALESEDEKTAYALGFKLGENIAPLKLSESEIGALQHGLADAAANATAKVEVAQYEGKIQQLAQQRASKAAEGRRTAETTFLDEMAATEGAERFPSGLIMIAESEGEGAMPTAQDKVKVHYHGTFSDGQVFDSSVQRQRPATFPLNGVIPCWTEALQKIKVGGKAKVVCPSTIAYGDQGAPPRIPPGAALVFDVELLEIVK